MGKFHWSGEFYGDFHLIFGEFSSIFSRNTVDLYPFPVFEQYRLVIFSLASLVTLDLPDEFWEGRTHIQQGQHRLVPHDGQPWLLPQDRKHPNSWDLEHELGSVLKLWEIPKTHLSLGFLTSVVKIGL